MRLACGSRVTPQEQDPPDDERGSGPCGKYTNAGPGTVRQLIVTGLGRDTPTVIITNDHDIKAKALIGQYARRMTIEQRLAEIIQEFCADALSSTVNLNVDLDIMLCLLAQALLAAFRARLGAGYHAAAPDTLQRRFPGSPGTIITTAASTSSSPDSKAENAAWKAALANEPALTPACSHQLTSPNPADLRGVCTNVCCRSVTSSASRTAAPVVSDAIAPRPSTRRAVQGIRRLTG